MPTLPAPVQHLRRESALAFLGKPQTTETGLQTAVPAEDAPAVITGNGVTKNIVPSLDGARANLTVYSGGCADREPEFLLVGDSIVRFVGIPNGITYCWMCWEDGL